MKELLFSVVSAAILGLFGFIGKKITDYFESKYEVHIKKETVKTCVEAVEQLYHDLQGPEKLERCKTYAVQMLQQKGIEITELELTMFIEAAVSRFNFKRLWGAPDGDAQK